MRLSEAQMMEFVTPTIAFAAGSLTGALLLPLANRMIRRKEAAGMPVSQASDDRRSVMSDSKLSILLVMVLNGAGWLCAALIAGISLQTIQIMLTISVTLVISIIDIKIRIIPNEMVLFLFASSLIFLLAGAARQSILLNLLGLAIGLVLFGIPLLLSRNIGAGDVKYIAAMGFCLGYPDVVKAVMIFGGILLIWLISLLATKRGGLRTKFAMGPFISAGFVAALIFGGR